MTEKFLGKIIKAEYGQVSDRSYLFGLQLEFKLSNGCCVGTGSTYTVNLNDKCKWENDSDRTNAILYVVEKTNDILNDAKKSYVSQLINVPVEVSIENNCFRSFRILTEVL